jgi:hypothetical protein
MLSRWLRVGCDKGQADWNPLGVGLPVLSELCGERLLLATGGGQGQ